MVLTASRNRQSAVVPCIPCKSVSLAYANLCVAQPLYSTIAFQKLSAAKYLPDKPARACYAVKELPLGAKVEIEAIAVTEGGSAKL